jgi:hypothetical protein
VNELQSVSIEVVEAALDNLGDSGRVTGSSTPESVSFAVQWRRHLNPGFEVQWNGKPS